jgi:hypothetical protein
MFNPNNQNRPGLGPQTPPGPRTMPGAPGIAVGQQMQGFGNDMRNWAQSAPSPMPGGQMPDMNQFRTDMTAWQQARPSHPQMPPQQPQQPQRPPFFGMGMGRFGGMGQGGGLAQALMRRMGRG